MKKIVTAAVAVAMVLPLCAQTATTEPETNHFGITFGYHHSMMKVTDIDKELFPDKTSQGSAIFSIFYQHAFGDNQQFLIRPELGFLNRGGGYKNIYSDFWKTEWSGEDIKDIKYNVKGHYIDFRLPLMYQFGSPANRIRPYVYVAPVIGFCNGGYINAEVQTNLDDSEDGYGYEGLHLDATKANMKSLYFAGMIGAGANWNFEINSNPFYLGLELAYEYGFTNTFGDDMDAENKYAFDLLKRDAANEGSRKYSGFEVKLTLGIPFSAFSKKEKIVAATPEPIREIVYIEKVVEEPEPDKSCYTLDEINELMLEGKPVEGKTICAIDDAINFEFGKSDIKRSSYEYLNRLAETLIRTNAKIKVKGHTDNIGADDFNMNLSRDRAMKVMDYLLKRGVQRAKLSYDYYGSTQPLTTNDTEEGRMMNRRVEFEIMN